MFETLFKPKIKVKFVDNDGYIRRQKKYPIQDDGKTIEITKVGGRGIPNATFNVNCVRRHKRGFIKAFFTPWKPRLEEWVELRPGSKECLEFIPALKDTHPDPQTVQEMAAAEILGKWGSADKIPALFYMNLALSGLIFAFLIFNSGVIGV